MEDRSSIRLRSPAGTRAVLIRVTAVVLGLAGAIGLAELGGRIFFGFRPPPSWAQTFASEAGYELHPDERYLYMSASGKFATRVRHNSRGLRDVKHRRMKPPEVFRVLVLDDSFAHAQEVALETTFPRRLETLLDEQPRTSPRIELINAGHAGLGTAQEYLYYTHEGRGYQPDPVLLAVYLGNDLVDNHEPLAKAWLQTARLDHPYGTSDGVLSRPSLAPRRVFLRWLRCHLFTAYLCARLWWGSGHADRLVVGTTPGDTPMVDPAALRVPLGLYLPPDPVWRGAWRVTDLVVRNLERALEADGARLAAIVIPDRRQLGGEDWETAIAQLWAADGAARQRRSADAGSAAVVRGCPTADPLPPRRGSDACRPFDRRGGAGGLDKHFGAGADGPGRPSRAVRADSPAAVAAHRG